MTLEYRIYRPPRDRSVSAILLGSTPVEEAIEPAAPPQAEESPPAAAEPDQLPTDAALGCSVWSPHEIDDRVVAILNSTHPGEPLRSAYSRIESELASLLATAVHPRDALTLQERFATPASSDATALAFGRLVVERRDRLLAVLHRIARSQVR